MQLSVDSGSPLGATQSFATRDCTKRNTDEEYELLLHSLSHSDVGDNLDRHVLLIEKWCRDNVNGCVQ